jgi:hypothetical protein
MGYELVVPSLAFLEPTPTDVPEHESADERRLSLPGVGDQPGRQESRLRQGDAEGQDRRPPPTQEEPLR